MIPLSVTFLVAKLIQVTVKQLGKGGGTALPGLIAYRLNRKLLPILAQQLSGTIVVSGTNGKTTTSRLIASYLEGSGYKIVHNRSGSNLTRGIVSTLIAHANWHKKIDAQWGLFEVDEAVFAEVVSLLKPRYVIANNLFRDQLDRYGEISLLAAKWRQACQELPDSTTLIINADDPLMASLTIETPAKIVGYGLAAQSGKAKQVELSSHADSRRCPVCGGALVFSSVSYSHLGQYQCANHDFKRPKVQLEVSDITLRGMAGSDFTIAWADKSTQFTFSLAGLYNIYNAAAALTLAFDLKLDQEVLEHRTKNFEAVFGRLEEVKLGNTLLTLILVKNPTGFNQVIQTLTTEPNAESFWLLLNDRFADGRDISWIWDVELEALRNQAKQLVIGGTRAYDMALRAKYADFAQENLWVAPSLADGLRTISSLKQGHVYCLCTYTAMLGLRRQLQKQTKLSSYHAD